MDGVGHALAQVRLLREIVDRQRFDGLSGRARITTAVACFAAGGVLCIWGQGPQVHLQGWLALCAFSLAVNAGALLHWFWFDTAVARDWRRLIPVLDMAPPLVVGLVLTAVFASRGHFEFLFGSWMAMYGLCNMSARHILPIGIVWIGLFYLICGVACFCLPPAFTDPIPMMMTFGLAEAAAGALMIRNQTRNV